MFCFSLLYTALKDTKMYWKTIILEFFMLLNFILNTIDSYEFDCTELENINALLPICLPKNYAKEIAPSLFNFKDREVAIYLDLQEIEDIDIIEGSVSYKLYLLIYWTDSRIVIRKDLVTNQTWNNLDLEVKNQI